MQIRPIQTFEHLAQARDLLARVWADDPLGTMPVNILKALAHTGHYVVAGWDGPEMVGASVAWRWAGSPRLHSHITGVDPGRQGRGLGLAIKRHQADWARAAGLKGISWTFDPLVRRNAWFNLSKLGARVESWLPDFYGPGTDRCLVVWDLEPAPPVADDTTPALTCPVPEDIGALRRERPEEAAEWARALRTTMGAAMDSGYTVTGFTREGAYLLRGPA